MKLKSIAAGIAALVLLTGPVPAADMRTRPSYKAPVYKGPLVPVPMRYSWSGCYLGVQGGYAWGTSQHRVPDAIGGVLSGVLVTNPFDVTGAVFGPTIGCNYQMGNWVIGAEGDWSFSSKSGIGGSAISLLNPLFTVTTNEKWLATVRGRIGYAWDRFLVYGTVGWAAARVEVEEFSVLFRASDTQTMNGVALGGGLEYAFLGNWSAKLEYLYVDFSPKTFLSPNPNPLGSPHQVTLNNHIVRAGVNYRFWSF